MNKLHKPRMVLLAMLLGFFVGLGVGAQKTSAHNGEDHSAEAQQAQQREGDREEERAPAANQLGKYTYMAQPGDSYTLMARKAAQTYGKRFNVKLSLAEIVFVETNLTQAAGSPQLNVGQQVEMNETTVKEWVDKATKLSPEQEAGWNHYVQFVDSFNTDAVGQTG